MGVEGTGVELKASVGAGSLHIRLRAPEQRAAAVAVLTRVLGTEVQLEPDPTALTVRADDAGPAGVALTALHDTGIALASIGFGQPSLDEVFLTLTGRPAAAPTAGGPGTAPSPDHAEVDR